MARLSDADRMRHMLDFAQRAQDASRNRAREDLDTDELFALAIERLLELLGEAASQVSKATTGTSPGDSLDADRGPTKPVNSRLRCRRLRHCLGNPHARCSRSDSIA